MKRYLHEAMKFGLLDTDPYTGLHFERGKFEKRKYLTEEELKTIHSCKINVPAIDRVRDLFLFQCYTGLAYSDFKKFDFEKDVEEKNGKYIVSDRRKKTNKDYKIVLLTPAIEILKKYDYKLPVISNQKYNVSLKVVAHGKSSVRCPLKPKRFYPLKIFNNAPSKSLDRWGYYYFSLFPSVCRHLPDTFSG
ncbi:hypothetical protein [uncultured Bacteroides sp.]|uniref:hypothetical protein n=1 Tax=uncultured Bacteroides sp. TaxID=162156 RepID=UPI0025DF5E72|nr:hypothetical protein [uncultured Bacteroides sp.]